MRDLPTPGIKPMSPASAGRFFTTEPPEKPSTVSGLLSMNSNQFFRLSDFGKDRLKNTDFIFKYSSFVTIKTNFQFSRVINS